MSASVQNNRARQRRIQSHSNRGGFPNSNSHRRETPEHENPPSPTTNMKVGGFEDPRTAMMMCTVLGAHSTVKTRNGNKYKGHTTGFSEKGDIAMTDVKLESEDCAYEQNIQGLLIPKDNFVVCVTNGVDIKGLSSASDFTDSAIASRLNGNSQVGMKELQPWQDDDAPVTPMTLDDDQTGGWEPSAMFQENKEKFNLKSSFPEDLRGYTTDLPDPKSEGYRELNEFAQKKAEEIERSQVYLNRIAKENEDGDEEAQFSSVHRNEEKSGVQRGHDSHSGSVVKSHAYSALRGADNEHTALRNGNQPRQVGRPAPRQNSPNYLPQSINSRQQHMNNHYHQSAPLPQRNQRQQQSQSPNHGPPPPSHPHPPHSMQHTAPLSQAPPMHQPSRHQQPPPQVPQQQQPIKPNLPHPNVPSLNQQQHMNAQKSVHPQQVSIQESKPVPHRNSQPPPPSHEVPVSQHVNGGRDAQHITDLNTSLKDVSHKGTDHYGPAVPTCVPLIPASKITDSVSNVNPVDHKPAAVISAVAPVPSRNAASPPAMPGVEKRNSRGQDTSPDENRNKVKNKNKVQQLKDFSQNFILDDSSKSQESTSDSTEESSTKSSASTSGVGTSDTSNMAGSPSSSISSTTGSEQKTATKTTEKPSESENVKAEVTKSTLNPLAAEFKPKTQATPVVEAHASPPPMRLSPHVPPSYPPNMAWVSAMPATGISYPTRTKGVLPMGRGDLTAQVTGQPLQMIYMHGQGPPYQVLAPNPRMVGSSSYSVSQAGQQGLDQSSPQPQVFVASQQPMMSTPIPAHLTPHPQPAHGQPIPNPTSQQPQPAHIPNPAPSPVHHQQQQPQAHSGQPLPHPIPQGPPQSVTPQPAHYPHFQHSIQTMPRTSAGPHGMGGPGLQSVSINYPNIQYSIPSASSAQNSFAPAPQPQMSQNSNHHNPGHHQHQYVVMPQPQGHTQMQPIPSQAYSSPGIQFQPQHNILHGPPQMPPNHNHNPNHGATNLYHSGVQGMPAGMQQVPGAPSNMLMSMHQPYPPQP